MGILIRNKRTTDRWQLFSGILRRSDRPSLPLPDFSNEPIQLEYVRIAERGAADIEAVGPVEYLAVFPNYPPQVAVAQGWVDTVREYQSFAALAFAYQNPNHPYSRFVRALHPNLLDKDLLHILTNQ